MSLPRSEIILTIMCALAAFVVAFAICVEVGPRTLP